MKKIIRLSVALVLIAVLLVSCEAFVKAAVGLAQDELVKKTGSSLVATYPAATESEVKKGSGELQTDVVTVNSWMKVSNTSSEIFITGIDIDGFKGNQKISQFNFLLHVSKDEKAKFKKIGNHAFEGCSQLTLVQLQLTEAPMFTIGERAFYDCRSLAKVHLPKGLGDIGSYAFGGSRDVQLEIIIEAETVPNLQSTSFPEYSKISAIKVPANKVDAYKAAQHWSAYAGKIVAKD